MSIVFAAIAVISFVIDQSVTSSLSGGEDGGQVFNPVHLIQTLIDQASGHAGQVE